MSSEPARSTKIAEDSSTCMFVFCHRLTTATVCDRELEDLPFRTAASLLSSASSSTLGSPGGQAVSHRCNKSIHRGEIDSMHDQWHKPQ